MLCVLNREDPNKWHIAKSKDSPALCGANQVADWTSNQIPPDIMIRDHGSMVCFKCVAAYTRRLMWNTSGKSL